MSKFSDFVQNRIDAVKERPFTTLGVAIVSDLILPGTGIIGFIVGGVTATAVAPVSNKVAKTISDKLNNG